mgnify:CR=1 FL=1
MDIIDEDDSLFTSAMPHVYFYPAFLFHQNRFHEKKFRKLYTHSFCAVSLCVCLYVCECARMCTWCAALKSVAVYVSPRPFLQTPSKSTCGGLIGRYIGARC